MQNALVSRTLTAKQSRFIDEYMVDMNGAAAAVRCGYSTRTSRAIAAENLAKPYIKAELQARGAALARELEITRAGVVKNLLEVFNMSRELKNPAAMISSMSTIAKILGYFSPEVKRVEVSAAGQDTLQRFDQMTDAELINMLAAGQGAS
ncbi:MAG: terminase small subunit [Burkholderiales bacterium]